MTLIRHPECGSVWTGRRREHCPACHHTFNSTYAADKHRRGTPGVDRRCINPITAGLVPFHYEAEKETIIVWTTPGRDDIRQVRDGSSV